MIKQFKPSDLVIETLDGELYEYYPLGAHIVMALGVCGGRPTFKYTRLEVKVILADLKAGHSIDNVVADFHRSNLTREAVQEAIDLAQQAFLASSQSAMPVAV
ncbi:MAG: DUF433 domain-containing protein [Chloroflexi bacterium]|nr:DUF433 domain-containing protein [Chloroflexota bacterium]